MSKKKHHIKFDDSIIDGIHKLIQRARNHPTSRIDELSDEHNKKSLPYKPPEPYKVSTNECDDFICITEFYNLIGLEEKDIQSCSKKITDKIKDRIKKLIPSERHKQVFDKLASDIPIDQITEEELELTSPIPGKEMTLEQKNACLAIIYGGHALRWLMSQSHVTLMLTDLSKDPGYKKFRYNFDELNRLMQSMAGHHKKIKRHKIKSEIFNAIDTMINDPKNPVSLQSRPLYTRLKSSKRVGKVEYLQDETSPDDLCGGDLRVTINNKESTIKFETFRQYVRDYKKENKQ